MEQQTDTASVVAVLLGRLRAERSDALVRVEAARAEVKKLDEAIAVLSNLRIDEDDRPELSAQRRPKQLRGKEAVRRVLASEPEHSWSVRSILEKLEEKGWINPVAKAKLEATRVAADRLAADGLVTKEDTPSGVVYRFNEGAADDG